MKITVALLQMNAHDDDQGANLVKGEAFCRKAAAMGADIALFPEMWNIGYTSFVSADGEEYDIWRGAERWHTAPQRLPLSQEQLDQERRRWQAQAIERDGPFVSHFRELAQELNIAIALTYLEKWPGAPRNSLSLIDRRGEIVMTYAKVHTCDFSLNEAACTPGEDFYVCALDTAQGSIQVGAMICYDREFPESARILMLKGAELILTPNACELETNRLVQFRTRAYENMVAVAMTNYAVPGQNGHSIAFDPIVCDEHGKMRDILVVEAGEEEGIFLAQFDMEKIREFRAREASGNAFRKPHRYGMITSLAVHEPFIRINANGERYDSIKR
jgi:N-carbamoylputrescine amidase